MASPLAVNVVVGKRKVAPFVLLDGERPGERMKGDIPENLLMSSTPLNGEFTREPEVGRA